MAGVAIGLALLTGFGLGFAALVVWAGSAAVLRLRSQCSTALMVVVLIAAATGSLFARFEAARPMDAPPDGEFEGELRIVDGPFLTQTGQRFTAAGDALPGSLMCVYAGSAPQVNTGDLVLGIGRVTLLQDLSDIGRAAASTRGCSAQLRLETMAVLAGGHGIRAALSRIRVELSRFLMQSAPGDTGALMSGLVTGDDGALSSDASEAFLNSGTTHVTAISGANLALIVLLLGMLTTGSMRRSLAFVLAATVAIWLYVLMVGMQPSALRAALLATAVLAGRWLGRMPDLLTLTVLLAALQVLIRPNDLETMGFQLSLAATIALIVVFDGRERAGNSSWMPSVVLSVFAAQLATLPILAMRIGEVSLISLLANLIIGPLAAIAFPLALVGAMIGQIAPTLGEAFLTPAIVVSRGMLNTVSWSQDYLPGTVQLGAPTPATMIVLTATTWTAIFWMSGDLRRFARYSLKVVRSW
jgi:ComEC/Rec2-related protein